MLTQVEADKLMIMPKQLVQRSAIQFPDPGGNSSFEAISTDESERFLVDVNRGRIRLSKCAYLERYDTIVSLVRLCLDGAPHRNPDDAIIHGPHIHLYREGFDDKWAFPLPAGKFTDLSDLIQSFREFLAFCNITNVPQIDRGLQ